MQAIINIDVDDLDKAIAFYERALGFEKIRLLFDGSVAELAGASQRIFLLQKDAGSSAVPASGEHGCRRDYGRHWTPLHLDFVVADVDTARERALNAGAIAEGEVTTAAWGRLAPMSDPFGHGFCFVEFQGDGYDAVAVRD